MKFLIVFIALSIVNVVFSTIRSITTIKSGKLIASLISGGYFAFYNIMLVWTVMDYPMWAKCLITFICNVVGVWIVKYCEEKIRKDQLWVVSASIKKKIAERTKILLNEAEIPYNCVETTGDYMIFNMYCETQEQSLAVKEIIKKHHAKYFVTESKVL